MLDSILTDSAAGAPEIEQAALDERQAFERDMSRVDSVARARLK